MCWGMCQFRCQTRLLQLSWNLPPSQYHDGPTAWCAQLQNPLDADERLPQARSPADHPGPKWVVDRNSNLSIHWHDRVSLIDLFLTVTVMHNNRQWFNETLQPMYIRNTLWIVHNSSRNSTVILGKVNQPMTWYYNQNYSLFPRWTSIIMRSNRASVEGLDYRTIIMFRSCDWWLRLLIGLCKVPWGIIDLDPKRTFLVRTH